MTILLLGANGQVGYELRQILKPPQNLIAFDRKEADFQDTANLRKLILKIKPKVIINAAAYTQVDKAESEVEKATLVNAIAVKTIAEAAKSLDAPLIHYSTDYVFDGAKEVPYLEEDQVCPINAYGKSKYDGERSIFESGCNFLIFRTSWVYGRHGNNFIKTILRLAQERETLQVVNDQVGAPTSAALLAQVTASSLEKLTEDNNLKGLYHVAPSGETNWFEFAKYIVSCSHQSGLKTKLKLSSIMPISSSEYPVPAKRPKNSRLDTSKFVSKFGIELPEWKKGVSQTISELLQEKTKEDL